MVHIMRVMPMGPATSAPPAAAIICELPKATGGGVELAKVMSALYEPQRNYSEKAFLICKITMNNYINDDVLMIRIMTRPGEAFISEN